MDSKLVCLKNVMGHGLNVFQNCIVSKISNYSYQNRVFFPKKHYFPLVTKIMLFDLSLKQYYWSIREHQREKRTCFEFVMWKLWHFLHLCQCNSICLSNRFSIFLTILTIVDGASTRDTLNKKVDPKLDCLRNVMESMNFQIM